MIARLIGWSARNLMLVFIGTVFAVAAGLYALKHLPLDAIPDLSDTQVIVYTEYKRAGPAGHRGPGDLSTDDSHADGAEVEVVRGFSVLRGFVRYIISKTARYLLGAFAGARISQCRGAQAADRRSRRHWDRTPPASAGLSVRPSVEQHVAGRSAFAAGLERSLGIAKAEGVAEVASVGGFVKHTMWWSIPIGLRSLGIPLSKVRT